jgi:hypothetical protein
MLFNFRKHDLPVYSARATFNAAALFSREEIGPALF